MSTPEPPKTDELTAIAELVAKGVPPKRAVEFVQGKVPCILDVAPLLRGEVECIRIPVWGSNGVPHIKVNEVELRVVEEVEWDRKKPGCAKCGHAWSVLLTISAYCPGCGNKIKR